MTTRPAGPRAGEVRKTLTLGHSPDPDDAFMFYGLATGRVDSGGWAFEHVLQDIQTLNDRALRGELDITAISIHAYPYVADRYVLTACGSSMGDGYGPMVVAREPMGIDDLRGMRIAVPGLRTTAFLALCLLLDDRGRTGAPGADGRGQGLNGSRDRGTDGAGGQGLEGPRDRGITRAEAGGGPGARRADAGAARSTVADGSPGHAIAGSSGGFVPEVVMFDRILRHVEEGRADAGLIIHEGQLTYANHNLHLVVDLGAWWKSATGLPLPLGGNVIRRDLGRPAIDEVAGILKRSIEFSLAHRDEAVAHAMQYARDMGRDLADRFVGMYVNDWTLDYGEPGRQAVRELLRRGHEAGLVPECGETEFVG